MNVSSLRLIGVVVVVGSTLAVSANANAPAGRYATPNGPGTVYDTKTKLTWEQPAASTKNFMGAKTYCQNLGATLGGAGWRLPTIKELLTIVDYSQATDPLIDRNAFPGASSNYFWSSTPEVGSPSYGWSVFFYDGTTYGDGVLPSVYGVRCVR